MAGRTHAALDTAAEPVWVPHDFLLEQAVEPWMGCGALPLWLPMPEHAGFMARDVGESLAAGLRIRPLADTATAALAWQQELGVDRERRTGITREREAELLARYRGRMTTPHELHDPDTVVVMGVSGVGKTTVAEGIARATGWTFAEGDSFHPPGNLAKLRSGRALDDEDRRPWLAALRDWIGEQERAGSSSVVTCSALKRAYRDALREGNASVRFCALQADRQLLRHRLQSRRDHFMPASLLQTQLDTLEPLAEDEPGARVDVAGDTAEVVARALRALGLPVDGAADSVEL